MQEYCGDAQTLKTFEVSLEEVKESEAGEELAESFTSKPQYLISKERNWLQREWVLRRVRLSLIVYMCSTLSIEKENEI